MSKILPVFVSSLHINLQKICNKNEKNQNLSFQSIKNIVCRQNASNQVAIVQLIPELNKFQSYDFFRLETFFGENRGSICPATLVQCRLLRIPRKLKYSKWNCLEIFVLHSATLAVSHHLDCGISARMY